MNNLNLENELRGLVGRVLFTLDQKKKFEVVSVTADLVTILVYSTEYERPISTEEIAGAYRRLASTGLLSRSDIRAEFSEYSSAYVAAILAELPGVKHTIRPIKLTTF